jgi:hypothetical protein
MGHVFETTDGGKHWQQVTGIVDADVCSCRFGATEGGNLWQSGPMSGRFIRGMVAVKEGDDWR